MKCKDLDKYLDDYVDASLEVGLTRDLVQHLESCPECMKKRDAIVRLLEKSRSLPKEVIPPHHLWPGINKKIEESQKFPNDQVGNIPPSPKWVIPISAAVVILMSALVYWIIQNPGDESGNDVTEVHETTAVFPTETILASYSSTRDMLLVELEKRRDQLDPDTVRIVIDNLHIMDRAAAQIQEALKKDPGNRRLERMLMASYHQQVRLLRQAQDIPSNIMR